MANGIVHIWAHGTSTKYNRKEADANDIAVSYTPNGIELKPRTIGGRAGNIKIFLPITVPSAISDAVTSFQRLNLHYRITGVDACIAGLRLLQNDTTEFAMADLHNDLPLTHDYIVNKSSWGPPTSGLPLVGNSLCLEIFVIIGRDTQDIPALVTIEGANLKLTHKKFDYE